MIWFTGDLHVGHFNILKYCKRPFNTVQEMDECLISNWNEVVKRGDVVYVLGDFAYWKLSDDEIKNIYDNLTGQKFLIRGNHDRRVGNYWLDVKDTHWLKKERIFLSHYSHRVWRNSCHSSKNLFGHSHGQLEERFNQLDVGIDNCDYYPINVDDAMFRIEEINGRVELSEEIQKMEKDERTCKNS